MPSPSPSPTTRRRSRRALRRSAVQEEVEDYLAGYSAPGCHRPPAYEGTDLDMALAISLSLAESAPGAMAGSYVSEMSIASSLDMSYENLVNLEDVRVVASPETVRRMALATFSGHEEAAASEELCSICQGEFVEGDVLMQLPCQHSLHKDCGEEWLLSYSKACPICKCSVCD